MRIDLGAHLVHVAALVLASTTTTTTALECFECGQNSTLGDCANASLDGSGDSGSEDSSRGRGAAWVRECGAAGQSCVSTVAVFGDLTIRSLECGSGAATNSCAELRLGDASAVVCSCDTDRCNGFKSSADRAAANVCSVAAVLLVTARILLASNALPF